MDVVNVKRDTELSPLAGWTRLLAASALAMLGLQLACNNNEEPASPAGTGGDDRPATGPATGSGGTGGGSNGQGGQAPAGPSPNPLAAPLVEELTRALSDSDETALTAHLGPTAFYVDAQGRSEAPGAAAALLAGGAWQLVSKVDSHHDVFRVEVQRGNQNSLLFGAVDAGGRASWLALAAPPPSDTTSTSSTLQTYMGAWNTGDPAARAALIQQCWSDSARYVDPANDARGPGGLDAAIVAFRGQLPGASIVPLTGALEAHGLVHFRWRVEGDNVPAIDGMDVGFVDAEGALTLIAGFFGPLSPR